MRMTRRSPSHEGECGFPQDGHLQLWGHLINTLASGLHLGTPRINTFSGDAMLGKTEVSFKQWCYEVQCVKDHYPELVVQ